VRCQSVLDRGVIGGKVELFLINSIVEDLIDFYVVLFGVVVIGIFRKLSVPHGFGCPKGRWLILIFSL
jgi:hypothetical protein